jgi:hypothetical protein
MAQAGDSFYNPVAKTRMVFTTLPRDNGGTEIAIDWFVAPGERLAAANHYHAGPAGAVVERFDIFEGSCDYTLDGVASTATGPAFFEVRAGMPHIHPRNTGARTLHVRQTVAPPQPDMKTLIRLEMFFETLMALSQQGKANRDGDISNSLQSALTIYELLLDPTWVAGKSEKTQRWVMSTAAQLARGFGFKAFIAAEKE